METVLTDFRSAIADALDAELAADPTVVIYGEDVASGGVFGATAGLRAKHGSERIFDTPISELALAGSAFGAAVGGLRPVVEIMFGDFLPLAMDALVNHAAKYWYVSNEQSSVPLVIRASVGAGGRFGAIHSQMPISWFLGVPGLKIVCPSTPADAYGLLRSAIRDGNPSLFLEHKGLYTLKGERGNVPLPIGRAKVIREGSDITVVSTMKTVQECTAAAQLAAADGVSMEVIDLCSLRPLDRETIAVSAMKTRRLLIAEEGPRTGGWAAEVIASMHDLGLHDIEAWRVTSPDLPIPHSPPLEDVFLPTSERILETLRSHGLMR
jgi:pyruvate/2-oxoglutarate/acetoin dehydrogenase E1 component